MWADTLHGGGIKTYKKPVRSPCWETADLEESGIIFGLDCVWRGSDLLYPWTTTRPDTSGRWVWNLRFIMPFAPFSSVPSRGLQFPADALCSGLQKPPPLECCLSAALGRGLWISLSGPEGGVNVKERRVKHFLSHLQKTGIPLLGVNHGLWFFSPVIFFQV